MNQAVYIAEIILGLKRADWIYITRLDALKGVRGSAIIFFGNFYRDRIKGLIYRECLDPRYGVTIINLGDI